MSHSLKPESHGGNKISHSTYYKMLICHRIGNPIDCQRAELDVQNISTHSAGAFIFLHN